ncbi:MAG TPA: AAA family ATPase [Thermoanaerobaculia bacterium]|nr:AAA family ATPase [Thermoanaerobaculia bacterium]
MIRRLVLRRFKRFDEVEFRFPGHVVLAGPNNTGKTTVLQAIAAWDLALNRWRQVRHANVAEKPQRASGKFYSWAPIARQAFAAVPLREFDLLWCKKTTGSPIEIEIQDEIGWTVAMELRYDSTEQILVRPTEATSVDALFKARLDAVYIPPMTGLTSEEPLYARPDYLDTLLGQGRPGEILRNLLVRARDQGESWRELEDSIHRLFGYEILAPDDSGPLILAEYRANPESPRLDIASAGSGFQQILMLLTLLLTHKGATLLFDEPDAHLHVILQDAIYSELRAYAAKSNSQLILATHSEVIINAVDPDELCAILGATPTLLTDAVERKKLIRSLSVLSNTDVMLAQTAPGILYIEDYTDLEILRAWAKTLNHPALPLLTTKLFWHKSVSESRRGGKGISSRDHYETLQLVRPNLPGLEICDRDDNPNLPENQVLGQGLQRIRWRRYEIESYLIHPEGLAAFIRSKVGPPPLSDEAVGALLAWMRKELGDVFLENPFSPGRLVDAFLLSTKARTEILPALLDAAGLLGFSYTRYHEIAEAMNPEHIHPEVVEKLDAIVGAFGG